MLIRLYPVSVYGASPPGAFTRGRGRNGSGVNGGGAAAETVTSGRISKRRRASSSSSFFYRDEIEQQPDDEEVEEEEDEEEQRVEYNHVRQVQEADRGRGARARGERHVMSNGRRVANGNAYRSTAANGDASTSPVRGRAVENRAGSGGGNGNSESEGRGISPRIEGMMRHQGGVLERHGKRELILRFSRQLWEEPPPPVEESLRPVAENLLNLLGLIDEDGFFAEPVPESAAPGYIAAILSPMDLGTMRKRAEAGCYRSVGELQDDLVLIVANCLSYNAPDTIFSEAAISLAGQAGGAYSQALASVGEMKGWVGLRASTVGAARGASIGAGAAGGSSGGQPSGVKRKRGRPRKRPLPPA